MTESVAQRIRLITRAVHQHNLLAFLNECRDICGNRIEIDICTASDFHDEHFPISDL